MVELRASLWAFTTGVSKSFSIKYFAVDQNSNNQKITTIAKEL